MPEIEFHTRKDGSQIAGVHIGGQVVVMSCAEWGDVASDILAKIKTHQTPFAADFAVCAPDLHALQDEQGFLFCGYCGKPLG